MKMKQIREQKKNPPYKHTCDCLSDEFEYLMNLPKESMCSNPRYYERTKENTWKDVTSQVTKE